jgi:putative ABC transport system substrate-binding protein
MTEMGYIEGEKITYLYDSPAERRKEAIKAQIDDALHKKVDLIYSLSTPATKAAVQAMTDSNIPGVFGPVFSPVDAGIVKSSKNPGNRMTGVDVHGSTGKKALEWLLAVLPDVKRIFIPFHATAMAARLTVDALRTAADKKGITIVTAELTSPEELRTVLENIPEDVDVIWRTCSSLIHSHTEEIIAAASARGIPVASSTHARVDSGLLISYGEIDQSLGLQVSRLADRLLKGDRPENLPVETAEFFLGINLKKADELGIPVNNDILQKADYIVR